MNEPPPLDVFMKAIDLNPETVRRYLDATQLELKCPVCLSTVHNPHSLPCTHFFCSTCLDNLFKQTNDNTSSTSSKAKKKKTVNEVICPICRDVYSHRHRIHDLTIRKVAAAFRALHALTHEEFDVPQLSQGWLFRCAVHSFNLCC